MSKIAGEPAWPRPLDPELARCTYSTPRTEIPPPNHINNTRKIKTYHSNPTAGPQAYPEKTCSQSFTGHYPVPSSLQLRCHLGTAGPKISPSKSHWNPLIREYQFKFDMRLASGLMQDATLWWRCVENGGMYRKRTSPDPTGRSGECTVRTGHNWTNHLRRSRHWNFPAYLG